MGTHVSFLFRGNYNPYFWGCKTFIFPWVVGVQGYLVSLTCTTLRLVVKIPFCAWSHDEKIHRVQDCFGKWWHQTWSWVHGVSGKDITIYRYIRKLLNSTPCFVKFELVNYLISFQSKYFWLIFVNIYIYQNISQQVNKFHSFTLQGTIQYPTFRKGKNMDSKAAFQKGTCY